MKKEIEKAKKVNRFWFIWNVIETLLLFAGGALAIVVGILMSQNTGAEAAGTAENVVAYVLSSFVILDGLLRVVMFLVRYQRGDEVAPMVVAGFEVAVGILLILLQSRFTAEHLFTFTIVNFIAIALIVMGALLLVYAIYYIVKRIVKLVMPVLEIFLGAILVGVGIAIILIYHNGNSRDMLVLIMTGAILCIGSIGMLIATIITHNKGKKMLKEAEDEEEGTYPVAAPEESPKEKKGAKESKVVEAETVEPEQLTGPKGIEHKK